MMASLLSAHGPLRRLWSFYERSLERRPIATQSVTSAVLWGCGDLLAQKFTCDAKQQRFDVRRAALTALFGGAVIGPAGHWWYSHAVDRIAALFGSEGTMRFLLAKLAADSTAWNVWYMSMFFLYGELVIERGTLTDFAKQMEEEFVPTYLAEVAAWPPIMAAIFTRLPVSHHLLAVNLVTVLDVAFLAVVWSGALSLGGSAAGASSSQGEELQDERSEDLVPLPSPAHGVGQGTHSRQQFMVPALASMHSAGRAAAAPGWCAARGGVVGASPSQRASLIDQWVLPEHKEAADARAVAQASGSCCAMPARPRG